MILERTIEVPTLKGNQWFAQNDLEFMFLSQFATLAGSFLEIGSRYGEGLRLMARHIPKGSRIVSVDLGYCTEEPELDTRKYWLDACHSLADDFDIHRIEGDSHAAHIVERVRALGPYDLVFIDGDHSYAGVMQDWKNYGAMGRVVAFHDIRLVDDVKRAWQEISRYWIHFEFVVCHGTGVILKHELPPK